MQDLFKRYATALDSTLLTQASTGRVGAVQRRADSVHRTLPTVALLYPKILSAANTVETALLAQAKPIACGHEPTPVVLDGEPAHLHVATDRHPRVPAAGRRPDQPRLQLQQRVPRRPADGPARGHRRQRLHQPWGGHEPGRNLCRRS